MSNPNGGYKLNVLPGDYGLISLDPECIQSILYSRIAKVPCEIRFSNTYRIGALYSTPSLVHDNNVINGSKEIIEYLRCNCCNLEYGLNLRQCSATMAVTSLVREKIKPLLEFVMWIDKRNSEELIIPWHMKVLKIPFNYFYTSRHTKDAENLIESMFPFEENQEVIKDHLTKMAIEGFCSLSSLLGEKEYFNEKSPTYLDVLVYSYLAPFVKLPFVSVDIGNTIRTLWPNLVKFEERIAKNFISDLTDNMRNVVQIENNLSSDDEVSISAVIILSVSAVTLAMTFIVQKGFFRWR